MPQPKLVFSPQPGEICFGSRNGDPTEATSLVNQRCRPTASKWPQPGSNATFSITSGNLLFEHWVSGFSSPPALQLFPGLTARPVGTTVPFPALNAAAPATPLPFEANAVWEASTETPNQ